MDHSSANFLTDIGFAIIFAAAAAHGARALKQPPLLGYVLGGILAGTQLGFGWIHEQEHVELISEIGLVLLLFIIGLEIKIQDLRRMGSSVLIVGGMQFPLCVGLGMLVFWPVRSLLGGGPFDLLYVAVALALSSTLIVVKLLHDKLEVGTVAGQITVGVLVLQDLWAVAFMAFQPNLSSPDVALIAASFGRGVVLVVAAFAASRWLLEPLYRGAAKAPEVVVVTSMAWCALLCGLAQKAGLSREMGALIAGMSIAAFPYGLDVGAKLAGVRDLFVTLFFVSLGLKVPRPTLGLLLFSAFALAFVIASRLVSVTVAAKLSGKGLRIGLISALNLAQVSEFSLVVLSIGAGYRHVSPTLSTYLLSAMLVASIASTYIIGHNHRIARWIERWLARRGISEPVVELAAETLHPAAVDRDILVLGCFREGQALLEVLAEKAPSLCARVRVVDYNPAMGEKLAAMGFEWVYGDLAHPQTLEHVGVQKASVLICSIPDAFLKGTSNRQLLELLRHMAPQARCVMSADDAAEARHLLDAGATRVMVPARLAGKGLFGILQETLGQG